MRVHDWRLLTAGGWLVAVALVEASFMYLVHGCLAGHWQQLYGELSGMHDRLQEAAGAWWRWWPWLGLLLPLFSAFSVWLHGWAAAV